MSQVNGDHRPPFQVFPDLPPEEFENLKQDIAERGVQVAIEITPEGEILDGHQRIQGLPRTQGSRTIRDGSSAGWMRRGSGTTPSRRTDLRRQLTRQQKT